jgi:hypothetical protein
VVAAAAAAAASPLAGLLQDTVDWEAQKAGVTDLMVELQVRTSLVAVTCRQRMSLLCTLS